MNAISLPRHAGRKSRGSRHIGGIGDGVVRAIGLRVIVRCLAEAAEGDDGEALARFREADQIRRQFGWSSGCLINGRAHPNHSLGRCGKNRSAA